jgi:hypothetical protein
MPWYLAILLLSLPLSLQGAQPVEHLVLDLPVAQGLGLPSWLAIVPPSGTSSLATQAFQISPPSGTGDLAATFYFTEIQGGFLRVIWQSANHSEMICDNLYEGVGIPNRRTLLIRRQLLSQGGELELQASSSQLGVSRIVWDWVNPGVILKSSSASVPMLALGAGQFLPEQEINGQPPVPIADSSQGQVVTVFLSEKPERIEKGLEIDSTIKQVPDWARLEAQFLGVDLNQPVQLWINDQLVGTFAMLPPDATDPGFTGSSKTSPGYLGWRTGAIYLPAHYLSAGENHFVITPVSTSGNPQPAAVKELQLQLRYPSNNEPSVTQH